MRENKDRRLVNQRMFSGRDLSEFGEDLIEELLLCEVRKILRSNLRPEFKPSAEYRFRFELEEWERE